MNLLLLACWLGSRGVSLTPERCGMLSANWRVDVTEPLRLIRYQVRDRGLLQPEVEACYRLLKQAELAAEQVELMQLWQTTRDWPVAPASAGVALIRANLEQYWRQQSLPPAQSSLQPLVQAAVDLSATEAELSSGPTY